MSAQKSYFTGLTVCLGDHAQALGPFEHGGHRRLNGLADHVLHPFALKTFEHGRVVQILAVLHDFDDFNAQTGGNRFFDIVTRCAPEG